MMENGSQPTMANQNTGDPFADIAQYQIIPNSQTQRRGRSNSVNGARSRGQSVPSADTIRIIKVPAGTLQNQVASKPMKRGRAESSSCLLCTKPIEQDFMICSVCDEKVCRGCSGIPENSWDFMKANTVGVRWICRPCDKSGLPTLKGISKTLETMQASSNAQFVTLNAKMNSVKDNLDAKIQAEIEGLDKKMDKSIKNLETSLQVHITNEIAKEKVEILKEAEQKISDKYEGRISAIEKIATAANPETLRENVKEIVRGEGLLNEETLATRIDAAVSKINPNGQPPSPDTPNTKMRKTISNVTAEMEEKKKRRKNVIIHGVEEPKTNVKDERMVCDKKYVKQVINGTLGVRIRDDEMTGFLRLGSKEDQKDKKRPLLVEFISEDVKEQVYRRLRRLRGSEHDHLSFRHDYTPLERENNKKLSEKAREMNEQETSGKHVYRVRGPPWDRKIRKFSKSDEQGGEQGMETEEPQTEETGRGPQAKKAKT